MRKSRLIEWQPEDSFVFAQVACLSLGLGMIVWGVAPAFVERSVTGHAPPLQSYMLNGASALLGICFLGLQSLIRKRVRWATWVTFALAAILFAAGLAVLTLPGRHLTSTFLLLLSGWTALAGWLAIMECNRQALAQLRSAPQNSEDWAPSRAGSAPLGR